ncbi:hypothetical protein FDP41_011530 [Naegleria fowleri]|uniref:Secondary thiamine-phosphate synthase enzyme n=1 Tax=Naegleria fowleri TaxID=5763 RepID=A0A6A5CA83_NAEFO|nr:uncharacterized protein FDP41_011530 [Naegleria fowleri]KAF0982600.1 hypothetical protein FDP41_011530 [Naegleria fowleri]
MVWRQKVISITAPKRGFHLVTEKVLSSIQSELSNIKIGLCHLFIQHTSASLTVNENYDPSVRHDLEESFNRLAPENQPYYQHTFEGSDDMPAHLKTVLIGPSITIPITNGKLALGTWQGIYLCEHRNDPSARNIVITIQGE